MIEAKALWETITCGKSKITKTGPRIAQFIPLN
jgi:hypothetical protein